MEGILQVDQEHVEKILEIYSERIWRIIGEISLFTENIPRAICAYESMLRHNPFSEEAHRALGLLFQNEGNYLKAIARFQHCLLLAPYDLVSREHLLSCFLSLGKTLPALELLSPNTAFGPTMPTPEMFFALGYLYEDSGEFSKAEEYYLKALQSRQGFSHFVETHLRLGLLEQQKDELMPGLDFLLFAENHNQGEVNSTKLSLEISHFYFLLGEYRLAKKRAKIVFNTSESSVKARAARLLGCILTKKALKNSKLYKAAFKYFEFSQKLQPNSAVLYHYRSLTNLQLGKTEEAFLDSKQATTCDPANPALWGGLGSVFYRQGKAYDALSSYTQAIRLWPNSSDLWFNIGVIYESSSNQELDAISSYAKALENNPNNSQAKQRLSLLRDKKPRDTPDLKNIDPMCFVKRHFTYFLTSQ